MAFDIVSSLLTLLAIAVLGGFLALGKKWLTRHIDRSVDHHYDVKLEEFKNNMETESQIKLQQLEQTHLLSREAFLHAHRIAAEQRLEAATRLWRGVIGLRRSRPRALLYLDSLPIESYDHMRTDPSYRATVCEITVDSYESVTAKLEEDDVDETQPLIGGDCLSLYQFYRGLIIGIPFLLKNDVTSNTPVRLWFTQPAIRDAISLYLDDKEKRTFEEKDRGRIMWLLGILEDKILASLDKIVAGGASIEEGIAQDNRIRAALTEDFLYGRETSQDTN